MRDSGGSYRQESQPPRDSDLGESVTPDARGAVLQAFPNGTKRDGSPRVPRISSFYGIVITMYHREHGVPHFHVSYGGFEASIEIETHAVHGRLPPRALRLALEWAGLHGAELSENWDRARANQSLKRIAPLE